MALNKVTINQLQGGLGRPLEGQDFISGFIFYSTALPSGYTNSTRIKEIFSVSEAEALGITDTHLGETRAIGAITVNATGATNDTITVKVVTPDTTITLGSYTQVSGDSTTTLVAASVASAINVLSATTGFVATASTATVSFRAPAGSGVGANSWTYSNEFNGTLSAYTTSFTGGVGSQIDLLHYHISEYFRMQPLGDLYVGVYSATTDYSEVVTLQNFALGKIRQVAVFSQSTFANAIVQYLQTAAETCDTNEKPLEVFLAANFSAVSDLTTLGDLHNLDSEMVSVVFGQDGAATGYELWKAHNKSVTNVGTFLGAHAFGKVSDSVAWAQKFRLDSVELETLAFANGSQLRTLSDGLINNIDGKGYVFGHYMASLPGSYFNNPYTATLVTSDYCRVPINRTVHKAKRGLRTFLDPLLASPVVLNADGSLTEQTVAFFKNEAEKALEAMVANQEISAFEVIINPVQNVLSTGILRISISIVPVGTADNIVIDLGLVPSISS